MVSDALRGEGKRGEGRKQQVRSTFIVSVESNNGPVTAEDVKTILAREWGSCFRGVTFKVEDGGLSVVSKMVSDYLNAEDEFHKFKAKYDTFCICNNLSVVKEIRRDWEKLADDVKFKRAVLVDNLRL